MEFKHCENCGNATTNDDKVCNKCKGIVADKNSSIWCAIFTIIILFAIVLIFHNCSTYTSTTPNLNHSGYYNYSTSTSTYSGNDTGMEWRKMNSSQKTQVINDIMNILKAKGMIFSVSSSYFVGGINTYYGDGGT